MSAHGAETEAFDAEQPFENSVTTCEQSVSTEIAELESATLYVNCSLRTLALFARYNILKLLCERGIYCEVVHPDSHVVCSCIRIRE